MRAGTKWSARNKNGIGDPTTTADAMSNDVTSEPRAAAGSLFELIDYKAVGNQSATMATAGMSERFTGINALHLRSRRFRTARVVVRNSEGDNIHRSSILGVGTNASSGSMAGGHPPERVGACHPEDGDPVLTGHAFNLYKTIIQ